MRALVLGSVLVLTLHSGRAVAQDAVAQEAVDHDAGAPHAAGPSSEGALGGCTFVVTGGQYWRSAIMTAGSGSGSRDGFAPLVVSVDVRVTCASDTTLRVAGAFVVVGGARRALHRPERYRTEGRSAWDGHVTAGTPIAVTLTWREGGSPPRDSEASAIVRLRTSTTGARTLELLAPTRAVAFVS